MPTPVLQVKDLRTHFFTGEGVVRAVDGVSFEVYPGEVLGIVGESGCGKSITMLSVLRLVPSPPGRIIGGEILLHGDDLLEKSEAEMCQIRGNRISAIFQDPLTSLNPVLTVGEQVAESFMEHQGLSRREALRRSAEILQRVHIPEAQQRLRDYPHQFSGGMRQRVMIAMALACQPDLLLADEPTTALDVTVQAQILRLLQEIKSQRRTAIVLITHDLGVVAKMCDRVAVMYAGRVVEFADVRTVFRQPGHPYTRGLLQSIVKLGDFRRQLTPIQGQPPSLAHLPSGCTFAPRCPYVVDDCRVDDPALRELEPRHWARCIRAEEVKTGSALTTIALSPPGKSDESGDAVTSLRSRVPASPEPGGRPLEADFGGSETP